MDSVTTYAEMTVGGLPLWAWAAIAVVVAVLIVAAVVSSRKRSQAIIKTRIG